METEQYLRLSLPRTVVDEMIDYFNDAAWQADMDDELRYAEYARETVRLIAVQAGEQ